MGKKRTFNDFSVRLRPKSSDFLVGFDRPEVGGEKKFPLTHLKNFMGSADVSIITSSQDFIINPNALPDTEDGIHGAMTFVNGKIFHANSENDMTITLPSMQSTASNEIPLVKFTLVNVSDSARVTIRTETGQLQAKGSVLRKKYDSAVIYFDGSDWFAFGDLDTLAVLNIKDVNEEYTFNIDDAGKLLHFYVEENTRVYLPSANEFMSGIQFYVYNFSDHVLQLDTADDSEIYARSIFLRRKYDDAVVYTDGQRWFATGDLS
jgi:hypothetical protein